MSRISVRGSVLESVRVDGACNDMARGEVKHWFFDDFVPTWPGACSGVIVSGPAFILDYWGAPLHVNAPTSQEWLLDDDALVRWHERTYSRLRAQGYAYTAVLDRRVTLYHDGAAIEVTWISCRADSSEIERLAVHFEIARESSGWRVVSMQWVPTTADALIAAWR
jgi:hypothetical protein